MKSRFFIKRRRFGNGASRGFVIFIKDASNIVQDGKNMPELCQVRVHEESDNGTPVHISCRGDMELGWHIVHHIGGLDGLRGLKSGLLLDIVEGAGAFSYTVNR